MFLVRIAVVLLCCAAPSIAFGQAVTVELAASTDEADATALRAYVARAQAELSGCLGSSARGRSETVLWLSVAPSGALTVSLALHRGPAEGVGPCIVERASTWRLRAAARRRIEMVLRTGAPAAAPAPPRPPSSPPSSAPSPSAPPSPPAAVPAAAPVPPGELPDVSLAYGPPSVSGPYPRAHVQSVALARRARLRRCYAEAVAVEPTLAGDVVLAFRIAPDGRVQSVSRQETTLTRPALEHCFVRALRTWRFPPHADATTSTSVRLRLRLAPTAQAD